MVGKPDVPTEQANGGEHDDGATDDVRPPPTAPGRPFFGLACLGSQTFRLAWPEGRGRSPFDANVGTP